MAHLAPPRHCAGAEMMLWSMLRPLVERGHQVDVILSRDTIDRAPFDFEGVTVHPRVDKHDPQEWVPKSDVVVCHLENTPRAVTLARFAGKPAVIVCHNTHVTTRTWLVDDAALVVFNSQWMAAELGGHPRGIVVRPPVYAGDYRTTPGRCVTLVNLYRPKGAGLFWELAERMSDIRFLAVIGAYGEQLVAEAPNVTVVPHTADMRAVYGATRIVVMPSAYESWGRVGVEAMCSGIPVIAAPTPGLVESLGAAGIFVDPRDVDGWETAIRRLLRPAVWKAQSALARARAAELDPTADLDRWVTAMEALV